MLMSDNFLTERRSAMGQTRNKLTAVGSASLVKRRSLSLDDACSAATRMQLAVPKSLPHVCQDGYSTSPNANRSHCAKSRTPPRCSNIN